MHIKNQKKGSKKIGKQKFSCFDINADYSKAWEKFTFITKVWFLSFIVVQLEKSSIFSYLLFFPSDFNFYYTFTQKKYHFILYSVKICNKKWEFFFFIISAISNASLCWLFISFVIINHHKTSPFQFHFDVLEAHKMNWSAFIYFFIKKFFTFSAFLVFLAFRKHK